MAGCDPLDPDASPAGADPPFQDLDAGDQWPTDSGTDDDESELNFVDLPGDDAGSDGESEDDAGSCLDIGWESYQVSGSCPGLPTTGAVFQDDDCTIEIPGSLGSVLGENGTVSGPYVTTTACDGVAEVEEFPNVQLTCLVDEASCQATLSGGPNNGFYN